MTCWRISGTVCLLLPLRAVLYTVQGGTPLRVTPLLCAGRALGLLYTKGPSGETGQANRSCSALSFRGCILQEGKQLPTQKHPSDQNSLLAGPALRTPPHPPPPQESPRQDLSCLEAGSLYRTSSTSNIASVSTLPPPPTHTQQWWFSGWFHGCGGRPRKKPI